MSTHFGTYQEFVAAVAALLEPTAAGKGYSTTGLDGDNPLYEFVRDLAGGPGHALGEIVYKARRYAAKRNPEDVLKIAAWAFLVWRHHVDGTQAHVAMTAPRVTVRPRATRATRKGRKFGKRRAKRGVGRSRQTL